MILHVKSNILPGVFNINIKMFYCNEGLLLSLELKMCCFSRCFLDIFGNIWTPKSDMTFNCVPRCVVKVNMRCQLLQASIIASYIKKNHIYRVFFTFFPFSRKRKKTPLQFFFIFFPMVWWSFGTVVAIKNCWGQTHFWGSKGPTGWFQVR